MTDTNASDLGGDELLALCPGISEKETGDKGELLKLAAKEKGIVLSVGTARRQLVPPI